MLWMRATVIDSRHRFAVVSFLAWFLVLVGFHGYYAVVDRYFLQDKGKLRTEKSQEISVQRGQILDRQNEPMAISTPVVAVSINPSQVSFTDSEVRAVAQILRLDPDGLASRIANAKHRSYLRLARRQPVSTALALQQLQLDGLNITTEYRRYYPMGSVTAHITGITDIDEQGAEGLEKSFNEHLKGESGHRRVTRDRQGRLIRDVRYVNLPKFGRDLLTSIDSRLQFLAQHELKQVVDEFDAEAATLILLDVSSGGILAMANEPTYNPNDTTFRHWSSMRNRSVTDRLEPGSTFKPFVALAALESGRYQPHTEVDTSPGWWVVRYKTIEDPVDYGVLTLREILVKSSQVGMSKVALDLPERTLLSIHRRAGFQDPVVTGLPGEALGELSGDDIEDEITRATMAYGYGFSVTPLHLAQAYLTLATGGVKRQISILLDDERDIPDERVFSEQHSRQVLNMLSGVVGVTGTASAAQIEGFTVAGKTGTVRKLKDHGYSDRHHFTLFVGMVPADYPKFLGVVVVDTPRPRTPGEKVSGGSVSAPLFKRIATRALQLRGELESQVSNVDSVEDNAA